MANLPERENIFAVTDAANVCFRLAREVWVCGAVRSRLALATDLA